MQVEIREVIFPGRAKVLSKLRENGTYHGGVRTFENISSHKSNKGTDKICQNQPL